MRYADDTNASEICININQRGREVYHIFWVLKIESIILCHQGARGQEVGVNININQMGIS